MSNLNDEVENVGNPEWRHKHMGELGRRLLTNVIDDRARRGHPIPYVSIPVTTNPVDGYRDITYREFARAIDKCAWWIKGEMGTSNTFESLIYVGAFDLRYHILAMAVVKTGHTVRCPMFVRALSADLKYRCCSSLHETAWKLSCH